MKKVLVLFLFFAFANLLVAQQKNVYYALDGSKWSSEENRDHKEDILWSAIETNFITIIKKKYPKSNPKG